MPHTLVNISFQMEVGKPREKKCSLDICLTSRSLVSRLVLFLSGITFVFNFDPRMVVLQIFELPFPNGWF
jgi:hypothetical protein